jgi:aspartate/methionine/tyrosine aminotransferase
LTWQAQRNRLAEAVAAAGPAVLDLTESNPTRAQLSYPSDILDALSDPCVLRYDPHPAGSPAARALIAAHEGVTPDRVFLTASTSEAYAYLFKLLADPGDEVLVPRPSYPLFEFLARLEAVRVIQYPLARHGTWAIDFDALAGTETLRTRAIIAVNPNNPTGSFLKREEFERLETFAAARDLAIISDEVFSGYAFGPDAERVVTLRDSRVLTFCLNGLSKLCGLPQMKLGWIVLGGPESARAQALARLEWIADTYLSVGAPVECAAAALLAAGRNVRQQIAARTAGNYAALRRAAAGSACGVLPAEGGWYAVLRVPGVLPEEEWCLDLLEKDGVLVQPGFFYDFDSEAFLVLSLLTPPEKFSEGVRRLLARVASVV